MSHRLRMVGWLVFTGSLASCSAEKTSQRLQISCPSIRIGRRIGEQPVHGFIFASAGSKVELRSCPGVRLHFAFIGDVPPDFRRLARVAEKRAQVVGFNAFADGYVVDDRYPSTNHERGTPESYLVLLDGLEDFREDPAVAAEFEKLLHQRAKEAPSAPSQ